MTRASSLGRLIQISVEEANQSLEHKKISVPVQQKKL